MSVARPTGRSAAATAAGNWRQKARLEFQGKSSWIEPVTVGQPDTFISVGCCPRGPYGRWQELTRSGLTKLVTDVIVLKDKSDD